MATRSTSSIASPGSLVPDYRRFCQSVTKVPEVDYWYPTGRRGRPRQLAKVVPAAAVAIGHRPDLIYGNRMMSTGWAIPAGKVVGAPIVCHEHGHDGHLSQRRIDRFRRHVDRFVVVSQFVADQWLAIGTRPRPGRGGLQRHRSGRVPLGRGRGAIGGTTGARHRRRISSSSPTSVASIARRGCTSCSTPGDDSVWAPARPGCWW